MTTAATIVGNVTRDPELRYTPTGKAVVSFGVAVNSRKRNPQTNEWEDAAPQFYDVVVWNDLGENVAESIAKGVRVVVVGRLQQRTWEADDGTKRSKIEVVADEVCPSLRWATAEVHKVDRRTAEGGGSARAPGAPPGAPPDWEPF